jgi:hypothetical protein
MTSLSQSSEFSECQRIFDNTSDSTSFNREQRKKMKLDDKLKFYSCNELHEGYIYLDKTLDLKFLLIIFLNHILQQTNVNLILTMQINFLI